MTLSVILKTADPALLLSAIGPLTLAASGGIVLSNQQSSMTPVLIVSYLVAGFGRVLALVFISLVIVCLYMENIPPKGKIELI